MSGEAKHTPCRVEGQFVEPCVSLRAVMDHQRMTLLTLSDRDFKPTRNMVVLKAGEHRKRGVVLNFCPFCGENISSHIKAEQPEAQP